MKSLVNQIKSLIFKNTKSKLITIYLSLIVIIAILGIIKIGSWGNLYSILKLYIPFYTIIFILLILIVISTKQIYSIIEFRINYLIFLSILLFLKLADWIVFLIFIFIYTQFFIGYLIGTVSILALIICLYFFVLHIIEMIKLPKHISANQKEKMRKLSYAKLKLLKELFDSGVISKEEFDEKKKKYIEFL
jgi:signal transduction histidine kinase